MTGPDDRDLRTTLGLGLAVAVLLGLAAAGGSVIRGTRTDATAGDAFPYALMGAFTAVAMTGIVVVAIRSARPGALRLRVSEWLAIVFIAAAIGALLGTAFTPDTPRPDEVSPLEDDEIERREEVADDVGESSRAGPVDMDGDGRPDLDSTGRMIIGFDADGDGTTDGYLQPCPDSTPIPEGRPGYVPFDTECDGDVDEWIPYDEALLETDIEFRETPPAPPQTVPPQEIEDRRQEQGPDGQRGNTLRNLLLILLVVAVAAAIIAWLVRMPDRETEQDDEPDDEAPPAESPTVDLGPSFEAGIDAAAEDPDPRRAICAAYGRLLEGFADVGLPRRPEEAPEEHVRRCIAEAGMDPEPVRELLTLFSLARFSTHQISEEHRAAAVAAMRAALASAPVPSRPVETVGR